MHDIQNNKKCKVSVLVYQRPNLRDAGLEYERFMGRDVLDNLFNNAIPKELTDVKKLFLSFPEQWLNIVEQRSLFARLAKYCPNLEDLSIKTHSVYIIQCTARDNMRIVVPIGRFEKILPQESVEGLLSFEQVGSIFGTGLNIAGGTIDYTNTSKDNSQFFSDESNK